jgi:SAM-dependent methyltransferase
VTSPNIIFDPNLLRRRLLRAAREPADFLLARTIEDLLDRLGAIKRPFTRILDVATPTPLLAQTLSETFRPETLHRAVLEPRLGGTGPWSMSMLENEVLTQPEQPFDLAVSALALQFINDLPGLMVQIRRALKPDGLFLAAMIGGQTLTELRTALTEAESEISGGASPRVAPFADLRDIGGLLQRAGFALPVTDIDHVQVRYDHIFALMRDLRAMGATNVLVSRSRKPLRRAILMRANEIYAERFSDADGRIRATFEIIWLSGWAPDASQQQPLKPGSAKMRLAEALRVMEDKR